MPQEPWKRAYDLSRQRRIEAEREAHRRGPRVPRGSSGAAGWIVAGLLLALIVAGVLLREQWLPLVLRQLPEQTREEVRLAEEAGTPPAPSTAGSTPAEEPDAASGGSATPAPRAGVIDAGALELGLGIHLSLLGNYLDLLRSTRDWEPQWQTAQTGPGALRLEREGLRVYVADGLIQSYVLDVPVVFVSEGWREWLPDLRRAGLKTELTWTLAAPEGLAGDELLLRAEQSIQRQQDWVRPSYRLEFMGGKLQRLRGELGVGTAAEMGVSPQPGG